MPVSSATETIPTFGELADRLVANGYCPVPILRGTKRPAVEGWLNYGLEDWLAFEGPPVSWAQSHGDCWTGVRLGVNGVWCLDIDIYDRALAMKTWPLVAEVLGKDALVRFGAKPKFAVLFRTDATGSRLATPRFATGEHVSAVEALGHGRQVVVFGLHPDRNTPYDWPKRSPLHVPAEELPFITAAALQALLDRIEAMFKGEGYAPIGPAQNDGSGSPSKLGPAAEPRLVLEALGFIPNELEGLHYDDWIRVGMAIKAALGEAGWPAFNAFSMRSHKYELATTERAWASFQPRGEIGAGSLFEMARREGWPMESARAVAALEAAGEFEAPPQPEIAPLVSALDPGELVRRWLTVTPPPTEWLVEGLIPETIAGLVVAAGGTGKSQLFLQLGMSLAVGDPWLDFAVPRPRRVVYIAAEDAERFIWQRIHAIGRWWQAEAALLADFDGEAPADGLSGPVLDALAQNLIVVPADRMSGIPRLTSTARGEIDVDAKGLARLLAFLTPLNPDLVCIDPAIRFMAGDENSSMDAARFVEAIEQLRSRLGCTVLVAHHKGKATGRAEGEGAEQSQYGARGSTALVDNSRFVVDMSRLTARAATQLYEDLDTVLLDEGRYVRWRVVKSNYAALGGEQLLMRLDNSPVLVPAVVTRKAPGKNDPPPVAEAARLVAARVRALAESEPTLLESLTVRNFAMQERAKGGGRLGLPRELIYAGLDYAVAAGELEYWRGEEDRRDTKRVRPREKENPAGE